MKNLHLLLLSFLAVIFCAFKGLQTNTPVDVPEYVTSLTNLTARWNAASTATDVQSITTLYYDTVSLCGAKLSKAEAVAKKPEFNKAHTGLKQSIGDVMVSFTGDMRYKTSFIKRTSIAGKESVVHAYLVFTKIGKDWKIVTESDDVTDANLAKAKQKSDLLKQAGWIMGDFDGNGKTDTLSYRMIKEGNFEDGKYIFRVSFSAPGLRPLCFGSQQDRICVLNEGDLDNTPGDEFSIYSPPGHGCTYNLEAFHFVNDAAEQLTPAVGVPTEFGEVTEDDIQNRIFKEQGSIYYYETDPNCGSDRPILIKTKSVLLKE